MGWPRALWQHHFRDLRDDLLVRRELELRRGDEAVADGALAVDEEQRGPRDVPRVEARSRCHTP